MASPKFLFVGRDEYCKGFRETLGAFVAISEQPCKIRGCSPDLTIVGVDRQTVARVLAADHGAHELGDRIRCFPSVTDNTLHELYEEASVVVAPSRYEAYGLVYREAAAFGRPLVACAENPAAVQFIAHAKCGLLAEECSARSIRKAIEAPLADSGLGERYGANGRRHAGTLTRRNLAEETLKVYRAVIANRHLVERTAAPPGIAH